MKNKTKEMTIMTRVFGVFSNESSVCMNIIRGEEIMVRRKADKGNVNSCLIDFTRLVLWMNQTVYKKIL